MTKHNWTELFESLPPEELDALAVLRIIETSNGCIQFAFRDKTPDALSVEDTRKAMSFSMSSIKRMQIVLEDGTIDFSDTTKEIMGRVRDLYLKGMKRGDDEAYENFLDASHACLIACGVPRLFEAKTRLYNNCYDMPPESYDWGLSYCLSFMSKPRLQ